THTSGAYTRSLHDALPIWSRSRTCRPSARCCRTARRRTMARVKRGVTAKARHRKVLSKAKGYYGARSKVYRVAKQAVIKAGQYRSEEHTSELQSRENLVCR